MAKLFLKFEQAVLKEVPLSQGVVTIGRLPDNVIHVDNLAVSGHHAKIYWEGDKYVLEDNNSLNGTFVNNRRVSKIAIHDGDSILIGKHTLVFEDKWHAGAPAPSMTPAKPPMPKMEATMVLDTKKAKEMMAAASAAQGIERTGTASEPQHAAAMPAPPKDRLGTLQVIDGKTDAKDYLLTGKMSVIGKSDMASIKLKGFFAPQMAALINKRDQGYFIAASEAKIKVKVNGQEIAGQKQLEEGDMIEVAGVKLTFGFKE